MVRAIAILTVLYIHATDGIYIISSDAIVNYTIYSRIFEFVSLFIGRIGVPFFLMITVISCLIGLMTMKGSISSGEITVRV